MEFSVARDLDGAQAGNVDRYELLCPRMMSSSPKTLLALKHILGGLDCWPGCFLSRVNVVSPGR